MEQLTLSFRFGLSLRLQQSFALAKLSIQAAHCTFEGDVRVAVLHPYKAFLQANAAVDNPWNTTRSSNVSFVLRSRCLWSSGALYYVAFNATVAGLSLLIADSSQVNYTGGEYVAFLRCRYIIGVDVNILGDSKLRGLGQMSLVRADGGLQDSTGLIGDHCYIISNESMWQGGTVRNVSLIVQDFSLLYLTGKLLHSSTTLMDVTLTVNNRVVVYSTYILLYGAEAIDNMNITVANHSVWTSEASTSICTQSNVAAPISRVMVVITQFSVVNSSELSSTTLFSTSLNAEHISVTISVNSSVSIGSIVSASTRVINASLCVLLFSTFEGSSFARAGQGVEQVSARIDGHSKYLAGMVCGSFSNVASVSISFSGESVGNVSNLVQAGMFATSVSQVLLILRDRSFLTVCGRALISVGAVAVADFTMELSNRSICVLLPDASGSETALVIVVVPAIAVTAPGSILRCSLVVSESSMMVSNCASVDGGTALCALYQCTSSDRLKQCTTDSISVTIQAQSSIAFSLSREMYPTTDSSAPAIARSWLLYSSNNAPDATDNLLTMSTSKLIVIIINESSTPVSLQGAQSLPYISVNAAVVVNVVGCENRMLFVSGGNRSLWNNYEFVTAAAAATDCYLMDSEGNRTSIAPSLVAASCNGGSCTTLSSTSKTPAGCAPPMLQSADEVCGGRKRVSSSTTSSTALRTNAVSGAAFVGLVTGSSGGGTAVRSALFQTLLSSCDMSLGDPFDGNYLQFGISLPNSLNDARLNDADEDWYFIRGAAVGSIAIVGGVVVLAIVVALTVATCWVKRAIGLPSRLQLQAAMGLAGIPGSLYLPTSYVLQPLTGAALTLLLTCDENSVLDYVIASLAAVVLAFAVGFVVVVVWNVPLRTVARGERKPATISSTQSLSSRAWVWLMHPKDNMSRFDRPTARGQFPRDDDGVCCSAGAEFLWRGGSYAEKYGSLFDGYTPQRYWFALIETSMNIVAGVLQATAYLGTAACTRSLVALSVIQIISLGIVGSLMPYKTMLDAIGNGALYILGALGGALALTAVFASPSIALKASDAAVQVFAAQLYGSIAMSIIAFVVPIAGQLHRSSSNKSPQWQPPSTMRSGIVALALRRLMPPPRRVAALKSLDSTRSPNVNEGTELPSVSFEELMAFLGDDGRGGGRVISAAEAMRRVHRITEFLCNRGQRLGALLAPYERRLEQ